jgi:hypothetical protein
LDFGFLGAFLTTTHACQSHSPRGALGKGFIRVWLMVFALLAGTAACAWAQSGAAQAGPDQASSSLASVTPAGVHADIAAATMANLHGTVTSTDGAVYEGARVVLLTSGGITNPAPVQTDSNGAFSFTNVPPGAFKLTVSSKGFIAQSVSGVLHAGEDFDTHTIALAMIGSTTEVTVSAESQVEIAQEQLNLEEKQRVLGVFPNYYVSYEGQDTVPLTTRQKYQLAWKTSIDPITWAMTGVVAGMEQASNTFAGYGQGAQGYGKRFGANYADGLSDTFIGGAILPSLFKQDPRFFYKGTGSFTSRAFYAIAQSVICKGDNGRWQPNYSAILGGLAAGGISNLYYPASSRTGVQVMFTNALIGTAEGAMQNLAQEFIVRRLTPRLPHYPSTVTQ